LHGRYLHAALTTAADMTADSHHTSLAHRTTCVERLDATRRTMDTAAT